MGRWAVEADADTIANIEMRFPVLFYPERECRDLGGGRAFSCSACGRVWHILVRTESGEWERVEASGSCPGCGARVVVEP